MQNVTLHNSQRAEKAFLAQSCWVCQCSPFMSCLMVFLCSILNFGSESCSWQIFYQMFCMHFCYYLSYADFQNVIMAESELQQIRLKKRIGGWWLQTIRMQVAAITLHPKLMKQKMSYLERPRVVGQHFEASVILVNHSFDNGPYWKISIIIIRGSSNPIT